jgi:hypothetical protein
VQKNEQKKRAKKRAKKSRSRSRFKIQNSNGAPWGLECAPLLFSRFQIQKKNRQKIIKKVTSGAPEKVVMAHMWCAITT